MNKYSIFLLLCTAGLLTISACKKEEKKNRKKQVVVQAGVARDDIDISLDEAVKWAYEDLDLLEEFPVGARVGVVPTGPSKLSFATSNEELVCGKIIGQRGRKLLVRTEGKNKKIKVDPFLLKKIPDWLSIGVHIKLPIKGRIDMIFKNWRSVCITSETGRDMRCVPIESVRPEVG